MLLDLILFAVKAYLYLHLSFALSIVLEVLEILNL